jgi:hypothetical protein
MSVIVERRVSYSRIAAPPTDCPGCAALDQVRAFCAPCRTAWGLPACWRCGDKMWTVVDGRWGWCPCTVRNTEARNEE